MVLRFVLPVLMRWLVVGFVKKQTRRYSEQFNGGPFQATAEPPRPGPDNGQVRVEYVRANPQAKRPEEFKGGEYVEFEEVK